MGWDLLKQGLYEKALVILMCVFSRGSRVYQLGVEQSLKVFVAIFVAGLVQKTTVDLSEFKPIFLYQEYL